MTQLMNTAELLRRAMESERLDTHTSLPGIVRSYDSSTQTAEIQLALTRAVPADDEDDSADEFEELPVLSSVPVCWPRGGGFFLHFPLTAGDSVLVIFPESDMNPWRASGDVSDPSVGLRHTLSSAVALPFLHHRGNPEPDADGTDGRIGKSGGPRIDFKVATIEVGGGDALVKASELDAHLAAITTAFKSLSSPPGTPYDNTLLPSIATTVIKGS